MSSNIFDNEYIRAVIKSLAKDCLGNLAEVKGDNIKDTFIVALEKILITRKDVLSKVDNKPENMVYSIKARYYGILFKDIVSILEESGYSPITPELAKEWGDKYDVVIEFIES
jgi:hypothetical protein